MDPAALETTAAVTIREGGRRPAGPDLGLIYCEGAYYTKFDFTLHGVTYPRGMKLLSIDGISPELFLAEQNDHLDNFDAARKTFYDSGEIPFYTRSGRWGKMPLVFRFERPDGATVTFPLASGDKLIWKGPLRQPWHIPRLVEYLPGAGNPVYPDSGDAGRGYSILPDTDSRKEQKSENPGRRA